MCVVWFLRFICLFVRGLIYVFLLDRSNLYVLLLLFRGVFMGQERATRVYGGLFRLISYVVGVFFYYVDAG